MLGRENSLGTLVGVTGESRVFPATPFARGARTITLILASDPVPFGAERLTLRSTKVPRDERENTLRSRARGRHES